MPVTKRSASDHAWNKDRLGGARARVEELKVKMNAHLHINSTIVFEADVAALHSAAKFMQRDSTKHREFDARAKESLAVRAFNCSRTSVHSCDETRSDDTSTSSTSAPRRNRRLARRLNTTCYDFARRILAYTLAGAACES